MSVRNLPLKYFHVILSLSQLLPVSADQPHLAEIYVNKCIRETESLFPGEDQLPQPQHPYVVVSVCHFREHHLLFDFYFNTSLVKHLAHFSPHGFLIKFSDVEDSYQATVFQHIYDRLVITSVQQEFFRYEEERYSSNIYKQFTAQQFKMEYLKTRFNIDEITLNNSAAAYGYFHYLEDQYPISLHRSSPKFKDNNISDLAAKGLFHTIQSGYGQNCEHPNRQSKLRALTYDFNAYDRIFCDVFEKYNLFRDFKGHYYPPDTFWLRGRTIRDDILTAFPPDMGNAVYYASPKLTFVVPQQEPKSSWLFATKPFTGYSWLALAIAFGLLEGCRRGVKSLSDYLYDWNPGRILAKRNVCAFTLTEEPGKLRGMERRYVHFLESLTGFMKLILMSAYGGMILFGILYPNYPWIPKTFEELNHTTNYFMGSAFYSPRYIMEHLRTSFILNGVDSNMVKNWTGINKCNPNLDYCSPADYLVGEELRKRNKTEDGDDIYHAAIMLDDKMDLWMKGRVFIWKTAPFRVRLKPSVEQLLPEMRYVSVAPGATRLHLIVEGIRRVITSGTWMRWYYLEQNYYKNVAPVIAVKKRMEAGLGEPRDENERRALAMKDLFSVFVLAIAGLGIAFAICFIEMLWTLPMIPIIIHVMGLS